MGNAAVLFLFIFLFGLGMVGVAATGFVVLKRGRSYLVPLFLFSLVWSLVILVITFHYFLYVYIDEHLRGYVPVSYIIYVLNVLGVFFLVRTLHRFANIRRVPAEAATVIIAGLVLGIIYIPSPLSALLRSIPLATVYCGFLAYAFTVVARYGKAAGRSAEERTAAIGLIALLAATSAADFFFEHSTLHPLTADHFSFAVWNAFALVLIARRSAAERNGKITYADIDARGKAFKLSPRERETLEGLLRGWSNKRIAHELSIEETTVKTYVASLFQKCGASSRYEIMSKFM